MENYERALLVLAKNMYIMNYHVFNNGLNKIARIHVYWLPADIRNASSSKNTPVQGHF